MNSTSHLHKNTCYNLKQQLACFFLFNFTSTVKCISTFETIKIRSPTMVTIPTAPLFPSERLREWIRMNEPSKTNQRFEMPIMHTNEEEAKSNQKSETGLKPFPPCIDIPNFQIKIIVCLHIDLYKRP